MCLNIPLGARIYLLHCFTCLKATTPLQTEFRTLAAQSGWKEISLKAVFRQSFNLDLLTELTCKGENSSFTEYIALVTEIDIFHAE